VNVLVLKLGALGNIVLSLRAFGAIRQHHPDARITLLTTAPYAEWMADAPWFDRVLIDARPGGWDLPGVLRLRRMLRRGEFDRVYDLQTSSRSSHYFRLFAPGARPEWSGIAPGCSHPDRDPDRDRIHDIDRQHGQLRQAGITDIPPPDLSWCRGDIARFALPRPFALLVPGSAPHRPIKRWPAAHYRLLAEWLTQRGIVPVVLGTAGERGLADQICAATTTQGCTGTTDGLDTTTQGLGISVPPFDASALGPGTSTGDLRFCTQSPIAVPLGLAAAATRGLAAEAPHVLAAEATRGPAAVPSSTDARDLTGQTSFGDLAELARAATLAIGNDTGPMHLLAAAGCPSLVLFSGDSDPARCAPRAPPGAAGVRVLRRADLATLAPEDVMAEVTDLLRARRTVPAEAPA
jgi:ADP-heptose:LPS heptosyltransferase